MKSEPTFASTRGSAAAILRQMQFRHSRDKISLDVQNATVLLYQRHLEEPLQDLRAEWFRAWRSVGRAAARGDLDKAIGELASAAAAWRAIRATFGAWVAARQEWLAVEMLKSPGVEYSYPAHMPQSSLFCWAIHLECRGDLPLSRRLPPGPECELMLDVLRLMNDPDTSKSHFREFFEYCDIHRLSPLTMGVAVAMVPPPDDLRLDACDYPPAASLDEAVAFVRHVVPAGRDPWNYQGAAIEFLTPDVQPEGLPSPPEPTTVAALKRLCSEIERAESEASSLEHNNTHSGLAYTRLFCGGVVMREKLKLWRRSMESAPAYQTLRALAMRMFGDLDASVCDNILCTLVKSGVSPRDADAMTLEEVVAHLTPLKVAPQLALLPALGQAADPAGATHQESTSSKKRRGRPLAKERTPLRYLTDLKLYADWKASGLPIQAFLKGRQIGIKE